MNECAQIILCDFQVFEIEISQVHRAAYGLVVFAVQVGQVRVTQGFLDCETVVGFEAEKLVEQIAGEWGALWVETLKRDFGLAWQSGDVIVCWTVRWRCG